jgi:hypothetical protein
MTLSGKVVNTNGDILVGRFCLNGGNDRVLLQVMPEAGRWSARTGRQKKDPKKEKGH